MAECVKHATTNFEIGCSCNHPQIKAVSALTLQSLTHFKSVGREVKTAF